MRLWLEGFLFVAASIDAPALTRARRQSKRSSKATAKMIETATETAMMRVVLLEELPAVTFSSPWPMMERDGEGGGCTGGGRGGGGGGAHSSKTSRVVGSPQLACALHAEINRRYAPPHASESALLTSASPGVIEAVTV